jgi:hypothetical protein
MHHFLKSSVLAIFLTLFARSFTNSQEIRVTDNKGTIKTVRNTRVTTSATTPAGSIFGDVWFDTSLPSIVSKIYDDSSVWKIIDQDTVTTNDVAPDIKNIGDIWLDTSTTPNTLNVWDGNSWILINGQFWSLQGNTGTEAATDFIGTLDTQDLVLKTNNIEKLRVFGTKGQVLINRAPTFNNHPLVIRANVNDVLAFQNSAGVPKWHWNLIDSGLNFVESDIADFILFLEIGGNVGINTNDPTERLDINGTLRVRDLALITANNDILTTNPSGVIQKKKLIASETENDLTLGANGGLFYTISAEAVTTDEILDGTILTQDIGQNGATEGQALLYNATTSKWIPNNINETLTTFSQETTTPTGVITYTNETGALSTANTVSADANNQIEAGTDGGAYLNGPAIKAAGKISANGNNLKVFNARVTRSSQGEYQVTFDTALEDADYIIQLTIIAADGSGNDDYDVSYRAQTTNGFIVETGDNDNGGGDRIKQDSEFMFTVIDF